MEGVMHDSQRCRHNAAECLKAAHKARQPHYRRLYLSMASTWLSIARQEDAMFDLLACWGLTELIKSEGIVLPFLDALESSPYATAPTANLLVTNAN
jgi:hypothetical protein